MVSYYYISRGDEDGLSNHKRWHRLAIILAGRRLTYQPTEKISYEWADGSLTFEIRENKQQTQLTFSEILPKEFPHRINDMAGWLVKKEHLSDLLNQCEVRADINHTRFVDEVTQIVQNF